MTIPDDILLFSGFALAHAAYSISDVPEGELLIPLFIAEHLGKRQVLRFEAATQEEAISAAKPHVDSVDVTLDLWTLSREGSMPVEDGSRLDVISVEASAAVFRHRVIVVQPFRAAYLPGGFGLLGQPVVALDGEEVSADTRTRCCQIIEEGFAEHPAAKALARDLSSSPLWQ